VDGVVEEVEEDDLDSCPVALGAFQFHEVFDQGRHPAGFEDRPDNRIGRISRI